MSLGTVFISETIGTAILLLLGGGVVANVILPKTKGFDSGWIVITFGWGLGVFAGVYAAFKSGAHLNFAVTIGLLANGAKEYAPGVAVTFASTMVYLAGEMLGAFLGAVLVFLAYKKHFDEDADPGTKLAVFSTGPAIRSYGWNFVTEVIGTFVLVFIILVFGKTPDPGSARSPSPSWSSASASASVAPPGTPSTRTVTSAPVSLTPSCPIKGKGSSDWGYAWVPVVGPIVGGVLAGLVASWYVV